MFELETLSQIAKGANPSALCSVVGTSGSTPRKVGAQMVVTADGSDFGQVHGTVGGGAIEHKIREAALLAIADCAPRTVEFALSSQLGMCCGGQMTIFIDPLRTHPPAIVLGAGHCGKAIAEAAALAGFSVSVADPRGELLDQSFSESITLLDDYEKEDLDTLPFGPDAFVVVVTHDHAKDQELIELVLPRPYRYLAMVGSERKARLMRERAKNKGFDACAIGAIRCPAGLDIGAETPEEIALSIVGEMVRVRRRGSARDDIKESEHKVA